MQPFYWLLRRRVLADQDFLADDDGARECSEVADYAQILFNFALTRAGKEPGTALGMAGRKSQLRRRIDMLLNHDRPVRTASKRKLLLPLVLFAVITLLGGSLRFAAQETAAEGKEPAAPPSGDTVPGSQSPYLWTSVIDAETQKPLAGVKATLYFAKPGGRDVDSRITNSDEQGRILFPLPSELNADEEAMTFIRVEKEGYVSEQDGRQAKWAERFLKEEKRIVCDIFPLQKAESITGRLVDEQGKPLAGILIVVIRQKVKPYGREALSRTDVIEFKSDAEGCFRVDAAKNEKIVFWAVPENLAPQYVFPDKKRGDQGNITLEKGFEPVVTVLDKEGKPVRDV
jgi:hypothetical protein